MLYNTYNTTESNPMDRNEKDRLRYANDEEYRLKVQEKNRQQAKKHRAKKTEVQRNKRRERRIQMVEYAGGKCVGCGTTENLQFDHIDRKAKKANVSRMFDFNIEILKEEVDKCQLLCYDCHEYKSLINHDKNRLAEGMKVLSVSKDGNDIIVRLSPI